MAKVSLSAGAMHKPVTEPAEQSHRLLRAEGDAGLVLICDHATNRIPDGLGTLGLNEEALRRHIAWDIGAGALTEALSEALGAPAVLANFSRLVIDPNRGLDDPTLIAALSDGVIIPGNRALSADARAWRIAQFYAPYHAAVAAAVARARALGVMPVLLSIHSFTPQWRGRARPWQLGILWNKDDRIVHPLLARLRAAGFVVGDNEPYSGALPGDTLDRHGTAQGLPHALIEVRQDLVATPAAVAKLARTLAPLIRAALRDAGLAGAGRAEE